MTADSPVNIDLSAKINADFAPLIQATPKGIERVFSCLFANREAENLRNTLLMAAKTQVEYEMILSGEYSYEDGKLVPSPYFTLRENLNPLQVENRQGLYNLAGNVKMAVEALRDIPDNEISDKEIDNDFFARWRQEAKVIGKEDIQRLWGRLLAEEIKAPDTISLRSLDVLKNITPLEAVLFQKIAPYITRSGNIICNSKALPSETNFTDLNRLRDAGLIESLEIGLSVSSLATMNINMKNRVATIFRDIAIVSVGDEEKMNTPGYRLSSSGVVALKICDFDSPNYQQIKYLCTVMTDPRIGNVKKVTVHKSINNNSFSSIPIYNYPETS